MYLMQIKILHQKEVESWYFMYWAPQTSPTYGKTQEI